MSYRKQSALFLAAALMITGGCAAEAPFQAQPGESAQAMQDRYLAWTATRSGWVRSASGLESHRLGTSNPTGATASAASIVTVQCEGRFLDGRLFFATDPSKPLVDPLTKLIKGWQEGVLLMHVGETWEFVLPPDLAYGEKGWHSPSPAIPSIPPHTALQFKIQLLAVENPPQSGK
ncbi:MAG TPA: FKBP-type peptidyl-prolyl cis-trans isomerase [Rhizomicrobium sp.]|jgi:FKBP-type peptidyl-prolyl cis-trans isomerase